MTGYIAKLAAMSQDELNAEIDTKIANSYHAIVHSDEASTLTAETNSSGWMADEYEVQDVDLCDDKCLVQLDFALSGDAEEDMGMSGTRITGTAIATIDDNGRVTYDEISGEVELD